MKLALFFLLATVGFTGAVQAGEADTPEARQQAAQRLQANAELDASILRVRLLTQPLNDRKAAGYAENRRRCQIALRVAALCGRFDGMFTCDETGFRPAPASVSKPSSVSISNGDRYKMERCEAQVKKEASIAELPK